MSRDPERILDLLSAVSGIIAFVWIGLRADVKGFKEAIDRIRATPRSGWAYWKFFLVAGPYLLFGLFLVAVVFFVFREPAIVIRHHVIKTIQSDTETVTINPVVEIASDLSQFEITITGAVYGPELRRIQRRFGEDQAVKVFAVVSEHSAIQEKQGLIWVQYYQAGTLSPTGEYVVRALLGGIGVDAAKAGDRFRVRIFIPAVAADVLKTPYESLEDLPEPLFLSEPIYIRCKRS